MRHDLCGRMRRQITPRETIQEALHFFFVYATLGAHLLQQRRLIRSVQPIATNVLLK